MLGASRRTIDNVTIWFLTSLRAIDVELFHLSLYSTCVVETLEKIGAEEDVGWS